MRLYYVVCDCGDGSSTVHWYKDEAFLYARISEDHDLYDESYYSNEGQARFITVPDDFDVDSLGVRFSG